MTLLVTAALYVGDKILAQIIKEEVWAKRLFFWFFPRITYTKLLEKLLNDTIIEFRNKFPGRSDGTKILFFEDKVTFDILSMYILFNQGNIELLVSDFEHRENVIKPTSEEISFFYDYFVQKINANKNLKYTFIEENYKGQIFKIQGAIDLIGSAVASIKGDTTEMKAQLSELVVELK